jgi:hypothetical protein
VCERFKPESLGAGQQVRKLESLGAEQQVQEPESLGAGFVLGRCSHLQTTRPLPAFFWNSSTGSYWMPGYPPSMMTNTRNSDEGDLKARINSIHGCGGLGQVFENMGIVTSEQLGQMTDQNYHRATQFIPQQRIGYPEDLGDRSLYGVGHLSSLEVLRRQCQTELLRARRTEEAAPEPVVSSPQRGRGSSSAQRGRGRRGSSSAQRGRGNSPTGRNSLREAELADARTDTHEELAEPPSKEPAEPPRLEEVMDEVVKVERELVKMIEETNTGRRNVDSVLEHSIKRIRESGHQVAAACEVLGCINHLWRRKEGDEKQKQKLNDCENQARDVMAWRCQLNVFGDFGDRGAFLDDLNRGLLLAARNVVESINKDAKTALCFLYEAAFGNHEEKQKFVSQALHSHRAVVANKFPAAFLSNCQRTAARRGRARNQRPAQRPAQRPILSHGQPEAVIQTFVAWTMFRDLARAGRDWHDDHHGQPEVTPDKVEEHLARGRDLLRSYSLPAPSLRRTSSCHGVIGDTRPPVSTRFRAFLMPPIDNHQEG